jgi:two-component system, cell cycle sensor histidine kinase and response regulator CckA
MALDGVILVANRAWRAALADRIGPCCDVGENYLAACARSAKACAATGAFATGLSALIAGKQTRVLVELPVDASGGSSQFSLEAQRIGTGSGARIALIRRDVTRVRSSEHALRESEVRFRELFEFAFDGVLFHDNGTIIDANQGASTISGFTRQELIGKNLLELLDEPSRVLTMRKAAEGVTTPYEVTMRRKDGSLLTVEGVGRPASYGGLATRITVIRDISARKRAEQRQFDSESKFRLLAETSPAPILIMQAERTLYANPAAAALTGYSRADLLGMPFTQLVGPEAVAAFYWRIMAAEQSDQRTERHELRLRGKDGREIWVDYMAARIEYEGAPAVLGTALDISERKRNEAMSRRLLHADRLAAIGQLSAGVAHEINNPAAFVMANLTSLSGVLDRIEQTDGRVPAALLAEVRDMLRDGLEGIERIHTLTKNLKTFARIERDDVELVDVNEVLNGACAIVADEIRGRARLHKQLGVVPRLAADPGKLSQVFINLLMNAAQAIDTGAADPHEIRCTSAYLDGMIQVTVADTGCGMPESVRSRIFEPFFTTKSRDQGTGLGLTLCADIVRRHSGEIRVKSEPGKGSVFEVLLPGDTGLVFSKRPQPRSDAPAPSKRARVLVIDDEEILLKAYRRMLASQHDVVVARGGTSALELLRGDANFDVVLCDLMMPDVDGKSVYEALSLLSPGLAARVIFCSGGAYSSRLSDFVAALPNVTLDKPFTADALLQAVAAARARR